MNWLQSSYRGRSLLELKNKQSFTKPFCSLKKQRVRQNNCDVPPSVLKLWRRWEKDIEKHREEDKEDVAHYTHPEAWVLQELHVVSAEEDVADGHPGHDSSKVSHEGHLRSEETRSASNFSLWSCFSTKPSALATCGEHKRNAATDSTTKTKEDWGEKIKLKIWVSQPETSKWV